MRHILLALPLLLAACGGQESGSNGSDGVDKQVEPVRQQGVPENLVDDQRNEAVPLEPPPAPGASATPARLSAFPPGFRGRWGLVAADCEAGRADNKGLMEVGATTLRFYESRGRVTGVDRLGPGRYAVSMAMTGEGQNWTARETFSLGGANALNRFAAADAGGALSYTRCPDQT